MGAFPAAHRPAVLGMGAMFSSGYSGHFLAVRRGHCVADTEPSPKPLPLPALALGLVEGLVGSGVIWVMRWGLPWAGHLNWTLRCQ